MPLYCIVLYCMPLEPKLAPCGRRFPQRRSALIGPFGRINNLVSSGMFIRELHSCKAILYVVLTWRCRWRLCCDIPLEVVRRGIYPSHDLNSFFTMTKAGVNGLGMGVCHCKAVLVAALHASSSFGPEQGIELLSKAAWLAVADWVNWSAHGKSKWAGLT